jgi:hypothetical protein
MGDNFNKLVLWFIVISLMVVFMCYQFNEASKYKTTRITTCGHVTDKILDGNESTDGEGNHYYTDHRVIVYSDKEGKRYTYEFKDYERNDFYKIKIGENFCASHLEEIKIK